MKRLLLLLFCLFALTVPVCAGLSVSADTLVYVTPFGERYHREYCSYTKEAQRNGTLQEMTIQEAVERGLTPCSRCRPGEWSGTPKRSLPVTDESLDMPPVKKEPDYFLLATVGGAAVLAVYYVREARKRKSSPQKRNGSEKL